MIGGQAPGEWGFPPHHSRHGNARRFPAAQQRISPQGPLQVRHFLSLMNRFAFLYGECIDRFPAVLYTARPPRTDQPASRLPLSLQDKGLPPGQRRTGKRSGSPPPQAGRPGSPESARNGSRPTSTRASHSIRPPYQRQEWAARLEAAQHAPGPRPADTAAPTTGPEVPVPPPAGRFHPPSGGGRQQLAGVPHSAPLPASSAPRRGDAHPPDPPPRRPQGGNSGPARGHPVAGQQHQPPALSRRRQPHKYRQHAGRGPRDEPRDPGPSGGRIVIDWDSQYTPFFIARSSSGGPVALPGYGPPPRWGPRAPTCCGPRRR